MRKLGLLVEDDPDGLNRAINCAPDQRTRTAYKDTQVEWHWVKSYAEFVAWIEKNGLPDLIAFDHDLGGNSYKLYHQHEGYVKCEINYDEYDEPTGWHCVGFLIEYCERTNTKFEAEVYTHSLNFKGRKNILGRAEQLRK
jgi:hypothetical protein